MKTPTYREAWEGRRDALVRELRQSARENSAYAGIDPYTRRVAAAFADLANRLKRMKPPKSRSRRAR